MKKTDHNKEEQDAEDEDSHEGSGDEKEEGIVMESKKMRMIIKILSPKEKMRRAVMMNAMIVRRRSNFIDVNDGVTKIDVEATVQSVVKAVEMMNASLERSQSPPATITASISVDSLPPQCESKKASIKKASLSTPSSSKITPKTLAQKSVRHTQLLNSSRSGSKSSSPSVESSLSRGSQSPPTAIGVVSAASTPKGYIYVRVREFYANLTNELLDKKPVFFSKVNVRGQWFSFIEDDIAKFLKLPKGVKSDEVSMDCDCILTKITGEQVEWSTSQSVCITHLTYGHASLMQFALSNLLPNSSKTIVYQDLAYLLFRITTGTTINLASFLMEKIFFFRREYFDGVYPKCPKAYVGTTPSIGVAGSSYASTAVHEVKQEVTLLNNRLAFEEEVQQEMSK
uniref:Putative plant transposon protein domain-containing protein n=1 Tax=Cannabis sativa TaxID=3483 RepID=A0A803Q8S6_CANSA